MYRVIEDNMKNDNMNGNKSIPSRKNKLASSHACKVNLPCKPSKEEPLVKGTTVTNHRMI